ncbi:MAG: hypothetical protein ACK5OX_00355 [Desertimonas sp.]
MTGALPPPLRRPLTRPWPATPRTIGGAALGWSVERIVDAPGPSWRPILATAVVALVAAAAPSTARLTALGGPPAMALATTVGLYVGVPETDRVVGLGAGLAVLTVAELLGASHTTPAVVVALGAALVWADLGGAGTHATAVVAGIGALGMFVTAPLVTWMPGPTRALVPRPLRGVVVIALHGAIVIAIGRRGAWGGSLAAVTAASVIGLVALTVAVRLVLGKLGPRAT